MYLEFCIASLSIKSLPFCKDLTTASLSVNLLTERCFRSPVNFRGPTSHISHRYALTHQGHPSKHWNASCQALLIISHHFGVPRTHCFKLRWKEGHSALPCLSKNKLMSGSALLEEWLDACGLFLKSHMFVADIIWTGQQTSRQGAAD